MTQLVIAVVVVLFYFGYRRSERLARELSERPSIAEVAMRGPRRNLLGPERPDRL